MKQYAPKSERLYEDFKYLCCFNTNEECIELIKYYLEHEEERKQISADGMAHAHEAFNCQRIAKDMIDFLTTGTYGAPWRDIYNV